MKIQVRDEDELNILCDYLNRIIEEAILHGGDSGGPYYINKVDLIDAIKSFLSWVGLEREVIIYENNIPKLLLKTKIKELRSDNLEKID